MTGAHLVSVDAGWSLGLERLRNTRS